MKKLILSAAIVLGGLTAVNAQTDKEPTAMNVQEESAVESRLEIAQDADISAVADDAVQDYKEVKASEVSDNVQEAVAKNYNGATISKAYVNAKGEYKLQLATADAKEVTVFSDAKGLLVQNEIKKQ